MHSLLILASLLATLAPASPLPEATLEAAPLIPERPQLMKGEIARLDPVSIHRNSIDTGKMRRSSLDPTFLLA